MPRIDLDVPFADKEKAKALGAKWDPNNKVWFVPHDVELEPFSLWRKPEEQENALIAILGRELLIAESKMACWKCKKETKVFALPLLSPNYDVECHDDDEDDQYNELAENGVAHFMGYTNFVTKDYAKFLNSTAPKFRVDRSKTMKASYWMNHCEHCDAKIGDFNLLNNSGPFDIQSEDQAKAIQIKQIDGYMEAECLELSLFPFAEQATLLIKEKENPPAPSYDPNKRGFLRVYDKKCGPCSARGRDVYLNLWSRKSDGRRYIACPSCGKVFTPPKEAELAPDRPISED